jgi:hypothetical protein
MRRLAGACTRLILIYIVGLLLTGVLASVLGHFVSSQHRASTSRLLLSGTRRQ